MGSILPGLERTEAHDLSTLALVEIVRSLALQIADFYDGGKAKRRPLVRAYFRALGDLSLRLAIAAEMDPASSAVIPFDIAYSMWGYFDMIGTGKIPEPVEDCVGQGTHSHAPGERKDICCGVAYIVAAKAGTVTDRAPVKTVATQFGVGKRTVQGWVAQYGSLNPALFCDGEFDRLESLMTRAGELYSVKGRSNHAIRVRAAKRP